MSDPFLIHGPAAISFSGGRTSAYMLRRILDAHGGELPADVVVTFANSGREMPATLDFVRDCGAAWNVPVRWLEYSRDGRRNTYREVSHNSAARDGEPFELLMRVKSMIPNPVMRFCTQELKIHTIKRFLVKEYHWPYWTSVIGLRADEPTRVERALSQGPTTQSPCRKICPLAAAGIEEHDVLRFWRSQPFDLRIAGPWAGNCDGCFLKSRAALQRMFVDHPQRMQWWLDMEERKHGSGPSGTFRSDRESYTAMAGLMRDQGRLPFDIDEQDLPCDMLACGI